MFYIQFKSVYGLETVDEFTTRKEAKSILKEYQLLTGGRYYISKRACKAWATK